MFEIKQPKERTKMWTCVYVKISYEDRDKIKKLATINNLTVHAVIKQMIDYCLGENNGKSRLE